MNILTCFVLLGTGIIDPRYHTYDEMIAEVESLAATYSTICRLDTLGYSTNDSMMIPYLKISDNPEIEEDEPAILYNGIHHAEEMLSGEVVLYLLNDLLSGYGNDPLITGWIDDCEIFVVPMLNPEGHGVVWAGLDSIWRKNKRDNNGNDTFDIEYDGVDLNRNYDFNWELGGSGDPGSEYYRGPAPFSENETQAMCDLAQDQHFVFDICYHNVRTGQGELVYFPWRWGASFCIDYLHIKSVCDSVAGRIITDNGSGTYTPIYGYATEGTARNWFYGVCGTYAYTIEVSWGCYPSGVDVDDICERNLVGAYYLLERVSGSSITGVVTDSVTGEPLVAEVRVAGVYDSTLALRQSEPHYGRYRRILNPGYYDLTFLRSGYQEAEFESVFVDTGAPTVLDVKLQPLAIEESAGMPDPGQGCPWLRAHPNPCAGCLTVEFGGFAESPGKVNLYDASGRRMTFGVPGPSGKWTWRRDRGAVPAGVYFIEVVSPAQRIVAKVVITD